MSYVNEYKKAKLHRVPLEIPHEYYNKIKATAAAAGESVNGYIKKAIRMRMEKEGQD